MTDLSGIYLFHGLREDKNPKEIVRELPADSRQVPKVGNPFPRSV